MTVLEPLPEDDVLALQPVVRNHNAAKLRAIIDRLEPEVDGSYGPVNPRMIEVYLKALRELGNLYRVYDAPRPREDASGAEERSMEALRATVARQLDELAARTTTTG